VETIKDQRFQVMSPHENHNHSLREMDALLQEMSHLNAGHTSDHMPEGLGISATGLWNAVTGKNKDWNATSLTDKRSTAQQSLCELALEAGGWSAPDCDKVREMILSYTHTKVHFPASKTYNLPTPAA